MARMHVLAPKLTPRGGIGVRMVSLGNGERGKLGLNSMIHNVSDRVTRKLTIDVGLGIAQRIDIDMTDYHQFVTVNILCCPI